MGERSQAFTRQTDTDQQGHFHFDIAQENNRDMGIEDRYRLCSEYAPSGTELRIVYPLICFPGVSDRDKAEWIELHPGQSRDITFPLRPVPAGTISGRVAGAHRITQLSVFHTDRRDFMNMGSVGDPWVKPKTSTFELAGMVPGKYRVSAESRSDATRLTCAADVDVRSGEVTSVALSLTPEAVLRGRVHADDSTTLKRENRRLTLHGRDGGDSVDAPIPEDGRFRVPVQKLESYRLSFDILPPWHVASATSGGHDVLAEGIHVGSDDQLEPVDVVLSRSVGTIEVSLTAQEGASEGSILLLHPVGSRVENAGHLMDGTAYIHSLPANFKWSHVPPGIYWVLAVSNIRVPYLEMKFLNQHREFIREVVVVAGGTSRAQLKLLDLN
jgi:hypothetical protein